MTNNISFLPHFAPRYSARQDEEGYHRPYPQRLRRHGRPLDRTRRYCHPALLVRSSKERRSAGAKRQQKHHTVLLHDYQPSTRRFAPCLVPHPNPFCDSLRTSQDPQRHELGHQLHPHGRLGLRRHGHARRNQGQGYEEGRQVGQGRVNRWRTRERQVVAVTKYEIRVSPKTLNIMSNYFWGSGLKSMLRLCAGEAKQRS